MKRKPLLIGATAAAVLALGGLGTYLAFAGDNDSNPTASAPTPTATATVTPSAGGAPNTPTPEPMKTIGVDKDGRFDWCSGVSESDFSGSAVEKFGAKSVKAAYCHIVPFTMDESTWIPSLLKEPAGGYKPEMFSFVKANMTPHAQKVWDHLVKKALNGDSKATSTIEGMTFFHLITDMEPVGGMVLNKTVKATDIYAWQDNNGEDRLVMTLDVSGDLVMRLPDGQHKLLPMSKTITYTLVENGLEERPWLIDGFSNTWKIGGKKDLKPMPQGSPPAQ